MFLSEVFEDALRGPFETNGYDVQYKVVETGDMVEIYFQGSVSNEDWKINFDFLVEPYKYMPVRWLAHRGFVTGYKSIRDFIMPRVKGKKFAFISGYSLGGAYAQLCLEDIRFTYPSVDAGAMVYGAPRVFWMPPKALKDRMEPLIRVCNYGDLVCHIPPSWLGFRHVGEKRSIGSAKRFIHNLFPIKQWTDLPTVKSHLIEEYRYSFREDNIANQGSNR